MKISNAFNALLIVIFSALVVRFQWHLLSYLEWGDEITHIISLRLITSGQSLYSQIHELHGPLIFLPGLIVEQFGPHFKVAAYRIPVMITQWLALIAIYFSPVLHKQNCFIKTSYCISVATIILLYFSDLFGHTYLFQVYAGLFIITILAQYTLPAILAPQTVNPFRIVIGNLLIASLPFLAITYIPISCLLFLASLRRHNLRLALIAYSCGFIFNIAFLVSIGSIPGYFSMHVWINAFVSRKYIEGEALGLHYLLTSALSAITQDLSRFFIFIVISCFLTALAKHESKTPWRTLLVGAGIASLLIRAMGFQGLPLLYISLCLPMVFLFARNTTPSSSALFLSPLLIVCFVKLWLLVPANIPERQARHATKFSQLVQKLTDKDDRIIAWPFENQEYIYADRLPASGNFFFLPWQKDYYANPKFGIKIDSCADIKRNRPKIMLINPYPFGGVSWADFIEPCIFEIIKDDYFKIPNTAIYIRNDIYIKHSQEIAAQL